MGYPIADLMGALRPKGDGHADDTNALQYIGSLGEAFDLDPSATYLITDTVTFTNSVDFNGAQIVYDGPRDRPAVVFGLDYVANTDLIFDDVRVKAKVRAWGDREFCGAVFNNMVRSTIRISAVSDFATGARFRSVFSGFTHNNVSITAISNARYGLDLLCDGQMNVTNYINENKFWGGDFTNHSPTLGLGDCYAHVYRAINGGYTGHNNNVFFSPCFQPGDGIEGDVRIPVLMDGAGSFNRYVLPRHESGRGPFAILDAPLDDTTINVDGNEFQMGLVSGASVVHGVEERNGARNNVYVPYIPAHNVEHQSIHIDVFENVKAHGSSKAMALGPFHFLTSGGGVEQAVTSITTKKDSLHMVGSRAVGFFVEVQGGESFVFAQAPTKNLCRLVVSVFDEDFNLLDDTAPEPPLVGQEIGAKHPWTPNYGGGYQMGNDAETFPFRVSKQVKYLRCIATGDGEVKSLSLTQFSGPRKVLTPFAGLEYDTAVYVADGTFTLGSVGKYRKGEVVPMETAAPGQVSYFQCTTGGRLASAWLANEPYNVDDVVELGSNVYVCSTAGTSDAVGPTGAGSGITDGTAVWDYLTTKAVFEPGPNL